jgi:hypothetical protein
MPSGGQGTAPHEWLPDPASVLATLTLTPRGGALAGAASATALAASPRYRILRTLEVDEYDQPIPAAEIMGLAAPRPAPADNAFRGKSRKAAKLSLADAEIESFSDPKHLIETLPDHATMAEHGAISTDQDSDRVAEERRNVRVRAFLYAASLENDRDYHLIIGREPSEAATYMTVEISGLPPRGSPHFTRLEQARAAYFDFFGDGLPGTSYDFYDPPIPVEVEGSLFFDFSHAEGSRPGPSKLRPKMPVVWEIHPVSKIVFEP